jgi:hypothetical protein
MQNKLHAEQNIRAPGNMLSYHVYTHCWEYLIEPIDMDKLFNPSTELRFYIEKARKKEKQILEERQIAIVIKIFVHNRKQYL